MNKLRFEVGIWPNGEKYLKHCMDHQPASDLEVKREIEILCQAFKIKAVTTGLCPECAIKRFAELDNEENND